MIGTAFVPKDAVSVKGELDKNGIKKVRVVTSTDTDEALDGKGQISDDGNKVIVDAEILRVTLTRK